MKTATPPEPPKQRTTRRVSKPLMEKRRRERINHSLETLRLLMLDNTENEKLKNPKVEKAEILESVVQFLKKEKEAGKGHQASKMMHSEEQKRSCDPQHSYRDGMRSCLLRVSQFIASRSQDSEESSGDAVQASFALSRPLAYPPAPAPIHSAVIPADAGGESAALSPQHLAHHHPYPTRSNGLVCDTKILSSTAPAHTNEPVWRPWPL